MRESHFTGERSNVVSQSLCGHVSLPDAVNLTLDSYHENGDNTFTWNNPTDKLRSIDFDLIRDDGFAVEHVYQPSEIASICSGTTCSITIPQEYWHVYSALIRFDYVNGQHDEWGWYTFSYYPPPAQISPVTGSTTTDTDFKWHTVTGANKYLYELLDENSNLLYINIYEIVASGDEYPTGNCNNGICDITPLYQFQTGHTYKWVIEAITDSDIHGSEYTQTYHYENANQVQIISPVGATAITQIQWKTISDANRYSIDLLDNGGNQVYHGQFANVPDIANGWNDGNCSSITNICNITPNFNFVSGQNYTVSITPLLNNGGNGEVVNETFTYFNPPIVASEYAHCTYSNIWTTQTSPSFDFGIAYNNFHLYWGTDKNGTSSNIIAGQYFTPAPITALNPVIYYLRVQPLDNNNLPLGDWSTAFIYKRSNLNPPVYGTVYNDINPDAVGGVAYFVADDSVSISQNIDIPSETVSQITSVWYNFGNNTHPIPSGKSLILGWTIESIQNGKAVDLGTLISTYGVSVNYGDGNLPANADKSTLKVAIYREASYSWEELANVNNLADLNQVQVDANQFGEFAIYIDNPDSATVPAEIAPIGSVGTYAPPSQSKSLTFQWSKINGVSDYTLLVNTNNASNTKYVTTVTCMASPCLYTIPNGFKYFGAGLWQVGYSNGTQVVWGNKKMFFAQ